MQEIVITILTTVTYDIYQQTDILSAKSSLT